LIGRAVREALEAVKRVEECLAARDDRMNIQPFAGGGEDVQDFIFSNESRLIL